MSKLLHVSDTRERTLDGTAATAGSARSVSVDTRLAGRAREGRGGLASVGRSGLEAHGRGRCGRARGDEFGCEEEERSARLPHGFAVAGDAHCALFASNACEAEDENSERSARWSQVVSSPRRRIDVNGSTPSSVDEVGSVTGRSPHVKRKRFLQQAKEKEAGQSDRRLPADRRPCSEKVDWRWSISSTPQPGACNAKYGLTATLAASYPTVSQ